MADDDVRRSIIDDEPASEESSREQQILSSEKKKWLAITTALGIIWIFSIVGASSTEEGLIEGWLYVAGSGTKLSWFGWRDCSSSMHDTAEELSSANCAGQGLAPAGKWFGAQCILAIFYVLAGVAAALSIALDIRMYTNKGNLKKVVLAVCFVNFVCSWSAGFAYLNNAYSVSLLESMAILLNGLWLLGFSAVCIWYLKHRPGPPLPAGERVALFGIKQTLRTLATIRRFPTMLRYGLAYLLFSDGYNTLIYCGVLFGRELLDMSNAQLAGMVLEVFVVGTAGTFLFLKIAKRYEIASKHMVRHVHAKFFTFHELVGIV